jgi:signal peptidase I
MPRVFREVIQTIVLALLLFFAIQATVQNYRVVFASMEPTLQNEDYLLVYKLAYVQIDSDRVESLLPFLKLEEEKFFLFQPPQRGDVIVLTPPGDDSLRFVKRIVGMPGETIRIHDGQVYIDEQIIKEPYIKEEFSGYLPNIFIPDEHYFIMGDNREVSNDSRAWGTIPLDDIAGKAWISYWPSPISTIKRGNAEFNQTAN